MRWGGALLLVLLGSTACLAEVDNVVVSWNSALQRTIRKLSIANQISSRYLTLLHVAQYQVWLTSRCRTQITVLLRAGLAFGTRARK